MRKGKGMYLNGDSENTGESAQDSESEKRTDIKCTKNRRNDVPEQTEIRIA